MGRWGGLGIHQLTGKATWHHLQRGSCVAGTPRRPDSGTLLCAAHSWFHIRLGSWKPVSPLGSLDGAGSPHSPTASPPLPHPTQHCTQCTPAPVGGPCFWFLLSRPLSIGHGLGWKENSLGALLLAPGSGGEGGYHTSAHDTSPAS